MTFAQALDMLAEEAGRLAFSIEVLGRELAELRDEMRDSLKDDRQLSLLEATGRNTP